VKTNKAVSRSDQTLTKPTVTGEKVSFRNKNSRPERTKLSRLILGGK
jgi:hypothetical protein